MKSVRIGGKILFSLLSASVMLAFGQSEPGRYASREFGIYFDVPAGWKLDRKPEQGLVAVRDSLGLLDVTITARIMPKKKDVREFADEFERTAELSARGATAAALVQDPSFPEAKRAALTSFVYDDTERVDRARKDYAEAKAQSPVDLTGDQRGEPGAIPDDREFLAELTTRLYESEESPVTRLVFYVIGGGVGYTVTVAAAREDFYAVLPLAQDLITALKLDKLSGGRYALPDEKALADAKKGIIMGKVLRNGRPVGGAAVNLYANSASYTKATPSHRARSNDYGEYSFTQLKAGRYYLLEVYGVSDEGTRVRSLQPITNIDVVEGRIVFVNIEVSGAQ